VRAGGGSNREDGVGDWVRLCQSPGMRLHNPGAECFVPDGAEIGDALARVTHLGIGAHHDDLEFMAFHGIVACLGHPGGRWFAGVTCTDGSGSARTGSYADCPDDSLRIVRRGEQRAAAVRGGYSVVVQLDYPSDSVKQPGAPGLVGELSALLRAAQPEVVYLHNLADKHDTHIAVAVATLAAIRGLPAQERPRRLLGCEVWRGLDWMDDAEKVALDVSGHASLSSELNACFDSQISGGKRYDRAVAGRRAANATFFDPRTTDAAADLIFAMDLTPLALDPGLDPVEFTLGFVDRFRRDVRDRLRTHFDSAA